MTPTSDWFAQNAPKASNSTASTSQDWFAANSPSNPAAARTARLQTPEPQAKGSPEWQAWRKQRLEDLTAHADGNHTPEEKSWLGTLWDKVNPFAIATRPDLAPSDAGEAAVHGVIGRVAGAVVQAGADQARQAKQAWDEGRRSESAAHALAAAIPVLGPMAAQFGEHAGAAVGSALGGNPDPNATREATTDAAAALLTMGAPKLVGGTAKAVRSIPAATRDAAGSLVGTTGKIVDTAPRPLSPGALAIAEKYNIPLTRGMQGGSNAVQAAEKLLGHTVAINDWEKVIQGGHEGLRAGAADMAGNFATDRYSAGQAISSKLLNRAHQLEQDAHGAYGTLAEIEADPKHMQTVETGRMIPNPSMDPTLPDMIPETANVPLPVDMRNVKSALAPLVEEISRRMTPAQKEANPGLAAARNILSRPDYLPASVAEADLGYLKEIMRSPATGQAKRVAGQAIDALDAQVKSAVSAAGPDALDALENARATWRQRSEVLNLLDELGGDRQGEAGQTAIARKLLNPADMSFPVLKKVLDVAPDAAPELARAYLRDNVFRKVADGENLTNARQASNLWNQMGNRTKAALFSPDQIDAMNNFLEVARRMSENPNPSNTAGLNAMMKLGILIASPVKGVVGYGMARKLANVLYYPDGSAWLRGVASNPVAAAAQGDTLGKFLQSAMAASQVENK